LLTAASVVALGRHPYTDWSGRLNAGDQAIVRQAITAVGATALAERQIGELSDGERQKIMIARALAQQPAVMILDEPTAFLDLPRRVEIMQLLSGLAHEDERAILLSTHDLDLALRSADRIWLMSSDGSLKTGAPEDLILSGAFEAAFRAEGVNFDATTGAFRVGGDTRAKIHLHGNDLFAIWTRRALERAGFDVSSNGGAALAHVEADAGRWRLISGETCTEYASIYELIEAIKRL
jgi:iron complex transport system ATP-binding protein